MSQGSLRRFILAASVLLSVVGGAYADEPNLDQTARITLACLLGGVPALSLILGLGFCIYIRKRKKQLRKHALANGIELDEEGWPVHHTQRVAISPSASTRVDPQVPQRDTRSYSSSAADYKAPSLYLGSPHTPRYHIPTSAQVQAGPLTHAITRDSDNYRPSTAH